MNTTEEILEQLVKSLSEMPEVQAIGISGSKHPLPRSGEGDIDIFIYCHEIPELEKRQAIMNQDKMQGLLQDQQFILLSGGHWGVGDYVRINGVETWLMYFTITETMNEINSTLQGANPDKVENYYYPVGRLAMLKNMNILYDQNQFLTALKNQLANYPDRLVESLANYHLDKLADTEDLERAVSRKDTLFYHFALDLALDHYLQALFAINQTYFPSRKRSLEYINQFSKKPERCQEILLEILRLGGNADSLEKSYQLLQEQIKALRNMT